MRAKCLVGVLVLSSSLAHAEGPWIVGASAEYIRDGRIGTSIGYGYFYDGPTGLGFGLEVGRRLRPWLSLSLTYQLTQVSGKYTLDPGWAELAERQHRLGPQIDLWPVPGRVRTSGGLVRSWRRSATYFDVPVAPNDLLTRRTSNNTYKFQLGVVPLRWRDFELELNAAVYRELGEKELGEVSRFSFGFGFGLRWRG